MSLDEVIRQEKLRDRRQAKFAAVILAVEWAIGILLLGLALWARRG